MNPLALISIIEAAIQAAAPLIQVMIAEAEVIGADVAAHKDAMATFLDAIAKLTAIFQTQPLPLPGPHA